MAEKTVVIGISEIVEMMVGQFAFFKAVASPEDGNFKKVSELSLDLVYERALRKWIIEDNFEGVLEMGRNIFERKLKLHLRGYYESILDVDAMSQNILFRIDNEYLA